MLYINTNKCVFKIFVKIMKSMIKRDNSVNIKLFTKYINIIKNIKAIYEVKNKCINKIQI